MKNKGKLAKIKPKNRTCFYGFGTAAIFVVALVFLVPQFSFAAPPDSPYAPGETLDPVCAPGDANCTVEQISVSTTTNYYGIGTSSPYAKLSVVGEIVGAFFTGTTTATSTLAGGLDAFAINQTGSATSTFVNGINISGGCFAISGTCLAAGSGSPGGLTTEVQFNDGGTFGGNANFVWDNANTRLGIGSTTPWGQLSINPDGISVPAFADGSSTETYFTISNGGKIGIGTSTPTYQLSLAGSLALPNSVSTTTGTILFGDNRFVYNYGSQNIFLGSSCGIFSLTGNSKITVNATQKYILMTVIVNKSVVSE